MKKLFSVSCFCICIIPAQAQFLKKIKEKVNKTVDNASVNASKSTNEGANANNNSINAKEKKNWCDAISSTEGNYSMVYSSPEKFTIMYDESVLGIGRNKSDYRLILKQLVDNKTQFIIVDNGKVTATVSSLTNDLIIGGVHQPLDGLNGDSYKTKSGKYIVAETSTVTVAGQDSKTVTTPKQIDADKAAQGYEMMKNTNEYKKMSPEEKKQVEETMKQIPQAAKDYNSSGSGGKTISTPEIKSGTYTSANGMYSIVIKGKNYGRFSGQPTLNISDDEANVYIVAADDKGKTNFIANDKRIPLTSKGASYMGHSGNLIVSPDGKKAVFIELKTLTVKEHAELIKSMESSGKVKNDYIVTKSDGTSFQLTRTDGGDKYRLTNSGTLVYLNMETREVFSDGKPIGKFTGTAYAGIIADGLIVGSDPSKICYYMDDGSLTYMDGSQKKMDIIFPQVITDNGKTYITWFRKCKNEIYIGKFEF